MQRGLLYTLSTLAFGAAIVLFVYSPDQPQSDNPGSTSDALAGDSVVDSANITEPSGDFPQSEQSNSNDGDVSSDAFSVTESQSGRHRTISLEISAGDSAEENAALVEQYLRDQGVFVDSDELIPLLESSSVGSLEIERVTQRYDDIPVYASRLLILRRGDTLIEIEGPIVEVGDLVTTPAIDESHAAQSVFDAGFLTAQLAAEPLYILASRDGAKLVWCFQVGYGGEAKDILVDAQTADVLRVVARGV